MTGYPEYMEKRGWNGMGYRDRLTDSITQEQIDSFPPYMLSVMDISRDADADNDNMVATIAEKEAIILEKDAEINKLKADLMDAQAENLRQTVTEVKEEPEEPEDKKDEDITFEDIIKDGEKTTIEY